MRTVGLEFNDAGVLAAVHDGQEVRNLDLNASPVRQGWPAFVLREAEGLVFGQPAEDRCMELPRQVSSVFLEELSHGSSGLGGVRQSPSFSELAYYFLRDLWGRVLGQSGDVDRVTLAVPPAYLETAYGRDEKIGLILGMAGDLGIPLVSLTDIALASLSRSLNPLPPVSLPIIHIELLLHSTQFTLLRREDGLRRVSARRVQQLGLVQMMRVLTDTMADRLLRQTAFDVSEDRRIEQGFYRKLMEVLASDDRSREAVLEIHGRNRNRQLKITRETLRADISPFVEALVRSLEKVVSEEGTTPDRCFLVLTDKAGRIRGLEARLRALGYRNLIVQTVGEAARGAAWLARDRDRPEDLSLVAVDESLVLFEGEREWQKRSVRPVLVKAEGAAGSPEPAPTHLVMGGVAHPIDKKETTIGPDHGDGSIDLPLAVAQSAIGVERFRLIRQEDGLFFELEDESESGGVSGMRERVECGDRILFSDEERDGSLLFVRLAGGAGPRPN
ncbi:MAG: hypothetical protein R3F07_08115 [Opitutaceae bacterium]